MLSIKSKLDIVIHVDLVNYLIGIFLQSSSENNYFIIFCHQFDKMNASRAYQEETVLAIFNIVY